MSNLDFFYHGRDVMITGGLGFIGSNLAIRLVGLGARVTLVDSLIPEYGGNLFNVAPVRDRVTINIADVRDEYSMNYLVQGRDVIFNLAGTLSHVDSMRDPYTDLEVNCRSQLSILESCRKHNPGARVVFAGTRGQYGRPLYLPVDEDHPQRPIDVNGINNMAGEWYHILYHQVYGIPTSSLRLSNTYGPRHQMRHHRQGIINWFVRQILEGQEVRLFGGGDQVRDTNYVDEVVEAFLLTAASEAAIGEVFNIGGHPASLRELVEIMIRLHGGGSFAVVPFPPDSKAIEPGDYVADWSKAQRVLGWTPEVGLEEGLGRTLAYYAEHRAHYW
jgi:UDP-glucose 4-epimerase